jgi:hypothetical protein
MKDRLTFRVATLLVALFLGACTNGPNGAELTPSSVPPTCSQTAPLPSGTDQTSAIQAALDATPDGGTLCFPRSGAMYDFEGTLQITGRHDLTIAGGSNTLQASSLVGDSDPTSPACCVRRHVDIRESSNIMISAIFVKGANTSCSYDGRYEFEAGFSIGGSTNVVLNEDRVTAVGGDGVQLGKGTVPNSQITVSNSAFNCIGRQGASIGDSASDVTFTNNTYDQVGRSVFDVEMVSQSSLAERITFSGNHVGAFTNALVSAQGGGIQRYVSVTDNDLTAEPLSFKFGSPDNIVDRFGFTFSNNTSSVAQDGSSLPMGLNGVQGATISGNVQRFVGKQGATFPHPAVAVNQATSDVTFSGNDFTGAQDLFGGDGTATNIIDRGANTP